MHFHLQTLHVFNFSIPFFFAFYFLFIIAYAFGVTFLKWKYYFILR